MPSVISYQKYLESFHIDDELIPIKDALSKGSSMKKLHFLNVTTYEALMEIVKAKKELNKSITCSIAPHYLYFSSVDVEPESTKFKCKPPLRDEKNQELLISECLARGSVDIITSMHFPVAPELKEDLKDFSRAMPGANTIG